MQLVCCHSSGLEVYVRKWMKGSYTVEAALLLPVIVIALLSILYISCYMYDCCLVEKSIHAVTLRGVCYQGSDKKCKKYMQNEWKKLTNDKLLGSKVSEVDITVNAVYVKVSCKTEFKLSELYKKAFSDTYEVTRLRIRGTDYIRTQYIMKEALD